jgi:hypothetical protein
MNHLHVKKTYYWISLNQLLSVFYENGWVLRFRHIISGRADQELGLLLARLYQVSLSKDPDDRFMRFLS